MSKVQILDSIVVNQIAAGEVVERPASVVKELVENAIDAGATEIVVSITNGGKTMIEVHDNGSGMTLEDAELAVERYGTSKVRSAKDLEGISTLGFRGEALPSIASVSKFQLLTAVSDDVPGTLIRIEGGEKKAAEQLGAPKGTRVSVRSLFFNVPARKKFLKTENTESNQIKALITDFALAYPEIRFALHSDGSVQSTFPQVSDFLARCAQLKVAGSSPIQVAERFLSQDPSGNSGGDIRISGVICSPIDSVSSAQKLRVLVNGRSVRDRLLLKAVRDGYGTFIRPGRHPAGVLSLRLPAEDVDVNVHPQKSEVRFRHSSEVFRAVLLSVSRALSSNTGDVSSVTEQGAAEGWSASARFSSHPSQRRQATPVSFGFGQAIPLVSDAEHQLRLLPSKRRGVEALQQMRFVGQILSLYLLFEGRENGDCCFAMLDMHAAHERVVFFRLKQQFESRAAESQRLLLPIELQLSPEEQSALAEGAEVLNAIGFAFRSEADSLVLEAIPAVLSAVPSERLMRDFLAEQEPGALERVLDTQIDHVLARIACHGSVRSGRDLKEAEVRSLLVSLSEADASGLCPHGRPVVRYFSEYELEQFFGRVQ